MLWEEQMGVNTVSITYMPQKMQFIYELILLCLEYLKKVLPLYLKIYNNNINNY